MAGDTAVKTILKIWVFLERKKENIKILTCQITCDPLCKVAQKHMCVKYNCLRGAPFDNQGRAWKFFQIKNFTHLISKKNKKNCPVDELKNKLTQLNCKKYIEM